MIYLIFGLLIVLGLLSLRHWFVHTPVETIRKQLRLMGLIVGLLLFVFLLATGRLAWLWAALVATMPWFGRAFSTMQLWQNFRAMYRRKKNADGSDGGQDTTDADPQVTSMERAAEILGLTLPTSIDAVHRAHRELMKRNHPDQGGNEYLAKLLNQARDILLQHLSQD